MKGVGCELNTSRSEKRPTKERMNFLLSKHYPQKWIPFCSVIPSAVPTRINFLPLFFPCWSFNVSFSSRSFYCNDTRSSSRKKNSIILIKCWESVRLWKIIKSEIIDCIMSKKIQKNEAWWTIWKRGRERMWVEKKKSFLTSFGVQLYKYCFIISSFP